MQSEIFQTLGEALEPNHLPSFTFNVKAELKRKYETPNIMANYILDKYKEDVKWSYLFSGKASICASRIFKKFQDKTPPIELAADI